MTSEDAQAQPIIDVWSRTTPKYRRQAVIMLILLAVLFGGLCCFLFWLRTGVVGPWNDWGYARLMRQSFQPAGPDQVTLSDFLRYPINVQEVPIHGVTMGLLLATLGSIPVLVAILYRFPFSILFSAMVVFLAGMPWLGITTLLGCFVACLPPFRFSFRYASALLGLVPMAVYFVSASWEPAGSQPTGIQNRALLYAPWVLAVVGACLICGLALAIAKLINYRAGGVPPLLAVLFAVPVLLFYSKIGRDELDYRILEREVGPASRQMFASIDLAAEVRREATRRLIEAENESYDEVYRRLLRDAVDQVRFDLEANRELAVARCDSFIEHFPQSRYVANVLYLKGRALDLRINGNRLDRRSRVDYYSDNPSPRSRRAWTALVERFPDNPLSAVGLYKLAILRARDGAFEEAAEMLATLRSRFGDNRSTTHPSPAPDRPGRWDFLRASPTASLGLDPAAVARRGWRLQELLAACRHDPVRRRFEVFAAGAIGSNHPMHALQVWLVLDENDDRYGYNLRGLIEAFPGSLTACHAAVRLAVLEPSISRRISRLRGCVESAAGGPCQAEALFRLAEACDDDSLMEEARAALVRLSKEFPDSYWGQEARDRLSSLPFLGAEPE